MREGWTYKTLGDLCDIISGRNQKDVESVDGAYPIFGSGGIMGHATAFLCEAGSTIVGRKGTINKPLYVSERFWNVDTAFGLQPNDITDSKFLFYLCKSIDFTKYDKSVTIPSLVKKDLLKIDVCCPPLTTQQQIVSELDLLSHILDQKRQQLKEYDALAESIFYDMFGDPVENPKGWEKKTLLDFCSNIVDCPHSTPVKADHVTTYPCIRTSELKGGSISWDSMQYLEEEEYQKRIARLKPLPGDIVFGREGTIGDAVLLPDGYSFSLGQRTMLLRASSSVNNYYLHRLLMSEWVKKQIEGVNVSSTVAHLNIKDFKQFLLPLPPLTLQRSFAAKIESIEHQKQLLRASIKETEMLFQSRMDYWFNS